MSKLKQQLLIVSNKNASNHIVNLLQYWVILENVSFLEHALLYKQCKLFQVLSLVCLSEVYPSEECPSIKIELWAELIDIVNNSN